MSDKPQTRAARLAPGWGFEWASEARLLGYPLVHVAVGFDARGRPRVARGVIAIGQFSFGLISIGQFGLGLLCGVGQLMAGSVCLSQFAIGLISIGQFALGWRAIGQFAIGYTGMAASWGWFAASAVP